jgi:hypothetical protein
MCIQASHSMEIPGRDLDIRGALTQGTCRSSPAHTTTDRQAGSTQQPPESTLNRNDGRKMFTMCTNHKGSSPNKTVQQALNACHTQSAKPCGPPTTDKPPSLPLV